MLYKSGNKATIHFRDDPERRDHRIIALDFITLRLAERQSDPFLDNLPPFVDDRFEIAAKRITIDDGIELFRELFPNGFADDAYIGSGPAAAGEHWERASKWQAHERYRDSLDGQTGRDLLSSGDIDELVRRAHLVVSRDLNLLSPNERAAFRDGLADGATAERFFAALFEFVAAEAHTQKPFTRLADAVMALPAKNARARVATWAVLTILPALADPGRFIFVKPDVTRACAERLRFDIQYGPALIWITYRKILEIADLLLERLRPLGAKDYIDVQSFMWVIAKQ